MDKKRKERILYNAKSKDLKKIVEVNKLEKDNKDLIKNYKEEVKK